MNREALRENLTKEYNYYKVKGDMETCTCGHRALPHSLWVPSEEADTNKVPELAACAINLCKCEKYKRDNLIYLENLSYQ